MNESCINGSGRNVFPKERSSGATFSLDIIQVPLGAVFCLFDLKADPYIWHVVFGW